MNIVFLCIKIFLIRMIDVSMGTIRTIVMVKGKRVLAAMIGFIEVLVWFAVAKEALNTPEKSILIGIFYAAGFSVGTWVGSIISSKFIKGNFGVQVITSQRNEQMIKELRKNNFAVSVVDVEGHDKENEKYLLLIEIKNEQLKELEALIKKMDPKAFVVVNETKYVQNGYFYEK